MKAGLGYLGFVFFLLILSYKDQVLLVNKDLALIFKTLKNQNGKICLFYFICV